MAEHRKTSNRRKIRKRRRRLGKLCFSAVFYLGILYGLYTLVFQTDFLTEFDVLAFVENVFDKQDEIKQSEWNLILVNRDHPIPKDYEVELTEVPGGELVDVRIYPALLEMLDAAEADGIYGFVVSGYRTAEKQQQLLDEKIDEYKKMGYLWFMAKDVAEEWVALPGTSEHQLGIAVDINADKSQNSSDELYRWLDQNAYKYGFIKRYPDGKTEITGVMYEPWHYRYVGLEAAAEMYQSGECLEEYIEQ